MARKLVYYCIGTLSTTAVWAMIVKTINPAADLTDVLVFVGTAFGTELLMLLVKRILAKPNTSEEDESI